MVTISTILRGWVRVSNKVDLLMKSVDALEEAPKGALPTPAATPTLEVAQPVHFYGRPAISESIGGTLQAALKELRLKIREEHSATCKDYASRGIDAIEQVRKVTALSGADPQGNSIPVCDIFEYVTNGEGLQGVRHSLPQTWLLRKLIIEESTGGLALNHVAGSWRNKLTPSGTSPLDYLGLVESARDGQFVKVFQNAEKPEQRSSQNNEEAPLSRLLQTSKRRMETRPQPLSMKKIKLASSLDDDDFF
ncbi:hypothetical protein HDU96_000975 [Phlyctochytrium bullatum]|nr:hypothetical protein HDU96_000975 [Phlyctochytrium bullatum]